MVTGLRPEHGIIRARMCAWQDSRRMGVLLMDRSGSVGLDLSFVPHVFLMEPFLDAALEEQVVARAPPPGARRQQTVGLGLI